MGHGSVIIDLAAEAGGNCEATKPGEVHHTQNGVTIDGRLNLPSRMAEHASQLYARNVMSLLELMTGEDAKLELDFEDEVLAGACVARDGKAT
jgi:NAD(P) transhydrogenase subunit alpha